MPERPEQQRGGELHPQQPRWPSPGKMSAKRPPSRFSAANLALFILPLVLVCELLAVLHWPPGWATLLTSLGLDAPAASSAAGTPPIWEASPRATPPPSASPAQGSAGSSAGVPSAPFARPSVRFQQCGASDAETAALLELAERGHQRNLQHRRAALGSLASPASVPRNLSWPQFRAKMLVPTYSCPQVERLGPWGEGGHWVCLAPCGFRPRSARDLAPPLIVSVGGGADTAFEADALALLHAVPRRFDPGLSPEQRRVLGASDHLHLQVAGLACSAREAQQRMKRAKGAVPWLTLPQMLKAAGAWYADVLKLDCRGCELDLFVGLNATLRRSRPFFGQILMQLPSLKQSSQPRMEQLILRLERLGYRMFAAEPIGLRLPKYRLSWIHESLVQPRGQQMLGPRLGQAGLEQALALAEDSFFRNVAKRGAQVKRGLAFPGQMSLKVFSAGMLAPTYPCFIKERFGLWGEGGKWVCMGHKHMPERLNQNARKPVVLSIGSRGESSFEKDIGTVTGSVPHTFDPFLSTKLMGEMMDKHKHLVFHAVGLAGAAAVGEARRVHPHVKWATLMEVLQLVGTKYVDILKVDCEGCEVALVQEMGHVLRRGRPAFGQIQMEIHARHNATVTMGLLRTLERLGYRMFSAEENAFWGLCYEVAFIHESLVHF